jgi:hypothetical protein
MTIKKSWGSLYPKTINIQSNIKASVKDANNVEQSVEEIVKEYWSKVSPEPTPPIIKIPYTPYGSFSVNKPYGGSVTSTPVEVDVGIRYDDGKLPMHLLPPELLTEVAKVLQFGAKKYAPRNWEKGMDWSRVEGSLIRHLVKWKEGEDIDPETGLSHISHVACNAAFLLAYINREVGKDDRPIKQDN